ncbi:MAG: ATP-binding protein [Candidatus Aminicenantes bacterium]|nr:MAG: ATP-binding protein [Candidatus Aminicenantes bacterium]
MKRLIDEELSNWANRKDRKVLLLRGARQVGKTFSIRELGKTFKKFLEVNFEENPHLCSFFKESLNPFEINEKLAFHFNKSIKPGETLLFFDEIQACPEALRSLRFYYEKMPGLHVAAAGSLLEFALSEIPSIGVGRIESLYMYPLTFAEFLDASTSSMMNQAIASASFDKPIDPVIHNRLLDKLKIFLVIGGMPKVVDTYVKGNDLEAGQVELDNILNSLYDDFAKYKQRTSVLRLQEVFKSIVFQTGSKFKYSNVSGEAAGTHTYKDALELLIKAGLAYKVYHTSARGLPLGGQINQKKFKVLFFDTGIFQRVQGLDLSQHIISDFQALVNRGNLCELFVGLELIAARPFRIRPELYYWHREARSSNAEIDYVISNQERIIPVEVKAGTRGQMQSLHLFLGERGLEYGLRISGENFAFYDNIKTIPLYAVSRTRHLT